MGMNKSSAKWIVHAIKLKSVPNLSLSCLIAIPQKYQHWNQMWAEEENRTVGSAKLRMRVNKGVEKNIWRVLKNGWRANWAACAAMLTTGGMMPAIWWDTIIKPVIMSPCPRIGVRDITFYERPVPTLVMIRSKLCTADLAFFWFSPSALSCNNYREATMRNEDV